MKNYKKYFEFSDAWVFTSLFMYDIKFNKINLTNLIANGDALNHSIFSFKELESAFEKLVKVGLIEIQDDSIRLTETGCEIKEKVANDTGGLFQKIDNTLRRIKNLSTTNSNAKLLKDMNFKFLTGEEFEKAYENYKK